MLYKITGLKDFLVSSAAAVVVVAALGSAMVWSIGYFATKGYADEIKCHLDASEEALSLQIGMIGYYTLYLKKKHEILKFHIELEKNPGDASVLSELEEARNIRDQALKNRDLSRERSKEAVKERQKC